MIKEKIAAELQLRSDQALPQKIMAVLSVAALPR